MKKYSQNKINCPICASHSYVKFVKKKYKFYICPCCSLIFLNPKQIAKTSKLQYLNNKTSPTEYYELIQKYDTETFIKRIKLIKKYKKSGKILDIGSSIGTFLKVAQKLGFQPTGIEPNPQAVEFSIKNREIKTVLGFFNKSFCLKNKKKFDIAYSSDVIEHQKNPVEYLNLAKKVVKNEGIIITITPNFDHFLTRLFQIKPLEHYLYLNIKSAQILHDKCKLSVLYIGKCHRKRSVKAMLSSTTFENKKFWRFFILIINKLKIYFIFEFILSFFSEDLIVIAKVN